MKEKKRAKKMYTHAHNEHMDIGRECVVSHQQVPKKPFLLISINHLFIQTLNPVNRDTRLKRFIDFPITIYVKREKKSIVYARENVHFKIAQSLLVSKIFVMIQSFIRTLQE